MLENKPNRDTDLFDLRRNVYQTHLLPSAQISIYHRSSASLLLCGVNPPLSSPKSFKETLHCSSSYCPLLSNIQPFSEQWRRQIFISFLADNHIGFVSNNDNCKTVMCCVGVLCVLYSFTKSLLFLQIFKKCIAIQSNPPLIIYLNIVKCLMWCFTPCWSFLCVCVYLLIFQFKKTNKKKIYQLQLAQVS